MIILLRDEMSSGLISSTAPPAAAIGPPQLSPIMKQLEMGAGGGGRASCFAPFLTRFKKPIGFVTQTQSWPAKICGIKKAF